MKSDRIKQIGFGVLLILVGLAIGWFIKGDEATTEHQHEAAQDQIWTCAMHPQIRQNKPGDCPICGMELIPLSETNSVMTQVKMSPTAMQLADIRTLVVGKGKGEKSLRLNGKVQEDERQTFTQSAHIPGRIETLNVNFTGEFVQKGQQLAVLYSPELVTAQEELLEAARLSQPGLLEAAKARLKSWKLTDQQIRNILVKGSPQQNFPVFAQNSGYITKKLVNNGEYIKQGQALYEISDLSKVWIQFELYETQLKWVKKGDKISFTVASLPGEKFSGKINYVDPTIDPKTRVALARLEVPNKGMKLKPEMFVSGEVQGEAQEEQASIVIPKTAVLWTGKRSIVYVKHASEQGVHFEMREVELGSRLGDQYVIESGLKLGDEIAYHGAFSIDAAAQLQGKSSMMNQEEMEVPVIPGAMSKEEKEMVSRGMNTLLDQYFELKNALTRDEQSQATKAATKMLHTVHGFDNTLNKEVNEATWLNRMKDLKNALADIQNQQDIETLRKRFLSISNAIKLLSRAYPVDQTIYVQHCPMADQNKGADWLSKDDSIINPYFGKKMISCGEVTEIINEQ